MRASRLMLGFCIILGGCATPASREAAAEARGYERGYRQAVKEHYWLIQQQQRQAVPAGKTHRP